MSRKTSLSLSPRSQPERSFCAPTTSKSPRRAASLRLCNAKADVPVPPSLLESPYLNSPMSPFQRAASVPCTPSQEDEEWLRDTIPLPSSSITPLGRSASTKENTCRSAHSQQSHNGTAQGGTIDKLTRPCSPPLLRLGVRSQSIQEKVQTPSLRLVRSREHEYFLSSYGEK
ncbi:hypothetical protein J3R30DRAFT_907497 [Lentinula aciculospora]|uniref:Uncharacterized protein n=1 Tax=Lentinula aciculospora TaxID=153920 RepID=A0A9W9ATH0_9AGAR|nr:hypothetical protein J3R30DRAFT_907497 [Lentinula aciculospora]